MVDKKPESRALKQKSYYYHNDKVWSSKHAVDFVKELEPPKDWPYRSLDEVYAEYFHDQS